MHSLIHMAQVHGSTLGSTTLQARSRAITSTSAGQAQGGRTRSVAHISWLTGGSIITVHMALKTLQHAYGHHVVQRFIQGGGRRGTPPLSKISHPLLNQHKYYNKGGFKA